jgi:hypothetical protein
MASYGEFPQQHPVGPAQPIHPANTRAKTADKISWYIVVFGLGLVGFSWLGSIGLAVLMDHYLGWPVKYNVLLVPNTVSRWLACGSGLCLAFSLAVGQCLRNGEKLPIRAFLSLAVTALTAWAFFGR